MEEAVLSDDLSESSLDLFAEAADSADKLDVLMMSFDKKADKLEELRRKVLQRFKMRPKALVTFDRSEETFSLASGGISLLQGLIAAHIGKAHIDPDRTGWDDEKSHWHATVWVRVSSPLLGSTVEMGYASSSKGFYSKRSDYEALKGPDLQALVLSHAITQAKGKGIMALCGLRGLSREELIDAGYNQGDLDAIQAGFKRDGARSSPRPDPKRAAPTPSSVDAVKDVFPGAEEVDAPNPMEEMRAMLEGELGATRTGSNVIIQHLAAFKAKNGEVKAFPAEKLSQKQLEIAMKTVQEFTATASAKGVSGDEALLAAAVKIRCKKTGEDPAGLAAGDE